jgi:hypothetical protein
MRIDKALLKQASNTAAPAKGSAKFLMVYYHPKKLKIRN